MIKWIGMTLLVLITIPAIAYYILVFHSVTRRELICEGAWERGGNGQAETAYVIFQEYRFWVWWTDSDGDVSVQTDKLAITRSVHNVSKTDNDWLAVYLFEDVSHDDRRLVGGYREANREITFKFADDLVFVGRCRNRV